jgi:hypothetical protein
MKLSLGLTLGIALVVSACRHSTEGTKDAADLAALETSLNALSYDLMPILSNGSVTSISQVKTEYGRVYTGRPPLFCARPLATGVLRDSEYELPLREYFWLPHWTSNDPPGTPIFWSHFHTPADVVNYLALDGSEHICSSNDFLNLLAQLSNRVERASLILVAPGTRGSSAQTR